jgi:protein-ribulosamine 3-kinase
MIPDVVRLSLESFFRENHTSSVVLRFDSPLSGGSINYVTRLTTSDGDYCLKYNGKEKYPEMFEKEKRGLSLLRDSEVFRVPNVICTGESGQYSYILLEFIRSSEMIRDFMEDFGRSLADLHFHQGPFFGLDHDNYMGALPQSNSVHDDFISFFIEERLEKQLKPACDAGYFSPADVACFHRLYAGLSNILPDEKPSLLHGDLWNGNYIVSEKGKACLIDPAVYYGNREIDIAMTLLFGGFDGLFYTSYNEAFPMEKGWRERMDLYNLYPLLIHLNLFGSGYLGSVLEIIRRF